MPSRAKFLKEILTVEVIVVVKIFKIENSLCYLLLNPNFYRAHNNLGLVYSYIDDLNSSLFHLKKAIDIEPDLSKAHNDIGTIYAKLGQFDKAIEEMEQSIEINPESTDYYYNLALIYEFLGEVKKAEELLRQGLDLEPDNEKIKNKLNGLE